jgi:dUTPase
MIKSEAELLKLVSEWHKSAAVGLQTLPEYLGMSQQEYELWVSNPRNARSIAGIPVDMLTDIYDAQEELFDLVAKNQGLTDSQGTCLTTDVIRQDAQDQQFGVNDLPNIWLSKTARALEDELDELNEELLWKWWSKDNIDIQNIRVEIVDLFHFLLQLSQMAGMTPEDIHRLYMQKNRINFERQHKGYSKATKDESDNQSIK